MSDSVRRAGTYAVGRSWLTLAVLLGVAIVHVVLSWGHGGLFWGDQGLWMHEVDRFAGGETPYRDFYFAYPPLAIWVLGWYARAAGSGPAQLWLGTSIVFLAIAVLYQALIARIIERGLRTLTALAAFLLAMAYANAVGPPLPLGMYTPAAPIGFLCVLAAILYAFRLVERPTVCVGLGVGVACGLSVLAKQDFWLPSAYVAALCMASVARTAPSGHRAIVGSIAGGAIAIVGAGAAVIAWQSGPAALAGLPGGFGQLSEWGGRGLPSWERLCIEVVGLGLLTSVVSLFLWAAGIIGARRLRQVALPAALIAAGGVWLHVEMGLRFFRFGSSGSLPTPAAMFVADLVRRGAPLVPGLLQDLANRLLFHGLPVLLPYGVLLFLIIRRRSLSSRPLYPLVLALIGLCAAARLRRLFEGVDWFHFLLEIPSYVLLLQMIVTADAQRARRVVVALLSAALVCGGVTYWYYGRGLLTRRSSWERVETARGGYYMPANQARDYRELDQLLRRTDPTGQRPLFAYGYAGGYDYFLGRTNPTPLTEGFRMSTKDPDAIVASLIHRPIPILLLDSVAFSAAAPEAWPSVTSWETPVVRNYFTRFDRLYIDRVLENCSRAGQVPAQGAAFFTLYDCR